jgi:hypothetical protein
MIHPITISSRGHTNIKQLVIWVVGRPFAYADTSMLIWDGTKNVWITITVIK